MRSSLNKQYEASLFSPCLPAPAAHAPASHQQQLTALRQAHSAKDVAGAAVWETFSPPLAALLFA